MTVVVVLFVLSARYEGRSVAWFPQYNGPVCLKGDDLLLILLHSNSACHEIKAKLLMAKRLVKWPWFDCDLAIIASLWGIVILLVFLFLYTLMAAIVGGRFKRMGHYWTALASVSRRVFMWKYSYEKVFPLRVHFHENQTDFLVTGFAQRPV